MLEEARALIDRTFAEGPQAMEHAFRTLAEQRGLGLGKLAQPVRVAATGTTVSPPLFETIALLGKERALRRIDAALEEDPMKALAIAVLLAATGASAAEGFKARGFILPDGAVKIDDDRYRLPQPWDEAVKFYRRAYPPAKFPDARLHSQTAVRAMHIDNPPGLEWEGVNLYEAGHGEVRVFILPGQEPPPRKAANRPRRHYGGWASLSAICKSRRISVKTISLFPSQ